MVVNRKVTGKAASMPGGLALGGALSLGVTILLAMVTAILVDNGAMEEKSIGYAALVILLLSSALGSAVAAARIKRQRLVVCIAAGAVYYVLLLSMTALFFGGQYTGMGVTALAVLGGSGVVCIAGAGQGRGRRKRKRTFSGVHR